MRPQRQQQILQWRTKRGEKGVRCLSQRKLIHIVTYFQKQKHVYRTCGTCLVHIVQHGT